jgi:hypothetical protein
VLVKFVKNLAVCEVFEFIVVSWCKIQLDDGPQLTIPAG